MSLSGVTIGVIRGAVRRYHPRRWSDTVAMIFPA